MKNFKLIIWLLIGLNTCVFGQKLEGMLDLSNQGLTAIPDSVWSLKNLEALDLSGNQIQEISSKIDSLKSLVFINLSGNPIAELPAEFYKLNFKSINVSNSPLYQEKAFYDNLKNDDFLFVIEGEKSITSLLQKNKLIRHLKLINCEISDSVKIKFPHILSVEVSSPKIKLDYIMHAFPKLRELRFEGEGKFKLDLTPFKHLKSLALKGIKVDFSYLKNQGGQLHTIRLNDVGLTSIPEALNGLRNLRFLDLSNNEIEHYRITKPEFKKLKQLDVRGNAISSKQLNRIYRNCEATVLYDEINEFIPEVAPEYKNKFKSFHLSGTDSAKLNVDKGLVLRIPDAAFETAKGVIYDGPITVKYRAFNNPIDFVFSGIPMSFPDETGWDYFQSLKMFEVRVFDENKEELRLRKGKPIKAEFRSTNSVDFKGWYLDTVQQKWKEIPLKIDSVVTINTKDGEEVGEIAPPFRIPMDTGLVYNKKEPKAPEYQDYRSHQKIYSDYSVWVESGQKNFAVYLAGKLSKEDKVNTWLKPLYDVDAIHQIDWKLNSEEDYQRVKKFCESESIIMFKVVKEEDHCIVKLEGNQSSVQFNAKPLKENKAPYSGDEIDKLISKINKQTGLRVKKWAQIDALADAKYLNHKKKLLAYEKKIEKYDEERLIALKENERVYKKRMVDYEEKMASWNSLSINAQALTVDLTRGVDYFRQFELPNLGMCNIDTKERLEKEIARAELIAKDIYVKPPAKGVKCDNYYLCDQKKNAVISFALDVPEIKTHKNMAMIIIYNNGDFGLVKSRGIKRSLKGKKMRPKIYAAENFSIADLKNEIF